MSAIYNTYIALVRALLKICRKMSKKCCSLCSCTLPEESSKRRRLHSTSSSFALQAFIEASSQCGLERVVPRGDQGVNGPFLCLACCSQLEKMSKLRANLRHLTEEVTSKIKKTAAQLNVSKDSTPPGILKSQRVKNQAASCHAVYDMCFNISPSFDLNIT